MITTLNVVRGDTKVISVEALDEAGDPLDLNLVEDIFFTVKEKLADEDEDALIALSLGNGIEIDDAPSGTATITLIPADTSSFPRQVTGLHYDVQTVLLDGKVFTLDRGRMNVLADVTRRVTA